MSMEMELDQIDAVLRLIKRGDTRDTSLRELALPQAETIKGLSDSASRTCNVNGDLVQLSNILYDAIDDNNVEATKKTVEQINAVLYSHAFRELYT